MDEETPETAEAELNPVNMFMDVLTKLDPTALPLHFICVAESLEEDGSTSLVLYNTSMPAWHMTGILHHVPELITFHTEYGALVCDDEDDDDF
jgi:hypothetical protein